MLTKDEVFEGVVAKCIAAGLVGGEGFSIDASLIKADVDKKKPAAISQFPGRRPRMPRARFASTSLPSMPPTTTRDATGMTTVRVAAPLQASRRKQSR